MKHSGNWKPQCPWVFVGENQGSTQSDRYTGFFGMDDEKL
jgi:hypothetical protein